MAHMPLHSPQPPPAPQPYPKTKSLKHMSGCQNYGPFLGTLNIGCRIIIETQEGTIILTTTHMSYSLNSLKGVI